MSIYEYDEEEHMRMEREDAFEDGWQAGLREGHEAGFKEALAQAEQERERADAAEANTEQERKRADAAEAELQKLKAELRKIKN